MAVHKNQNVIKRMGGHVTYAYSMTHTQQMYVWAVGALTHVHTHTRKRMRAQTIKMTCSKRIYMGSQNTCTHIYSKCMGGRTHTYTGGLRKRMGGQYMFRFMFVSSLYACLQKYAFHVFAFLRFFCVILKQKQKH